MPALGPVFDDAQIASLLTYIRREWDHTANPVSPDAVRMAREQSRGRNAQQWTAPELEKVK